MTPVMTVLGPVEAEDLGRVLPHEHLLLDLYRVFQPHRDMKLFDSDLAAAELADVLVTGGGTVVEVTTPDFGRDPAGLKALSERTGVQIVMGSGWYREPFYSADVWTKTTAQLARDLIRDIEEGVDGVRPGIIGEIGTHQGHISPVEEKAHRAVARAHLATGLTISTHSNATDVGLAQLDLLAEEGVPLDRVVVGHCDTYPVLDYHLAILDRGAWIQFDTIRGTFEFETERQLRMVLDMIGRGHIDRLLLSQDLATDRLLKAYGGNGFGYLFGTFGKRLLEAGLSEDQLDTLFRRNPQRMLAGL